MNPLRVTNFNEMSKNMKNYMTYMALYIFAVGNICGIVLLKGLTG